MECAIANELIEQEIFARSIAIQNALNDRIGYYHEGILGDIYKETYQQLLDIANNYPYFEASLGVRVVQAFVNREFNERIMNQNILPTLSEQRQKAVLGTIKQYYKKSKPYLEKYIGTRRMDLIFKAELARLLDPSGLVAYMEREMADTADAMTQFPLQHQQRIRQTNKDLESTLNQNITQIDKSTLMDGIEVYLDKDAEEGKLVKYTVIDGIYEGNILKKIVVRDPYGKTSEINPDEIIKDESIETVDEYLLNLVKEKYQNALINEILDGEVRQVVQKPHNDKAVESYIQNRLNMIFGMNSRLSRHNKNKKGYYRSPFINYTSNVKIGDMNFRVGYVFVETKEFWEQSYEMRDGKYERKSVDRRGEKFGDTKRRIYKNGKQYYMVPINIQHIGRGGVGKGYNFSIRAENGNSGFREFVKNYSGLIGTQDISEARKLIQEALPVGFYKASENTAFKDVVEKGDEEKGIMYLKNTHKLWHDYERMPNQPIEGAMNDVYEEQTNRRTAGIMSATMNYMREFDEILERGRELNTKNHQQLAELLVDLEKKLDRGLYDEIVNLLGVNILYYVDPQTGELTTPNGEMSREIYEDYFPNQYSEFDVINMARERIADMTKRLNESIDPDERENLEAGIAHMDAIIKMRDREGFQDVIERQIKHQKQRQPWTDKNRRRKDGSVVNDYFESYGNTLTYNNRMARLLRAVDKLHQNYGNNPEVFKELVQLLHEQLRAELGDPYISAGIGSLRFDYSSAENYLRSKGIDKDKRQIASAVKWIRSVMTGLLLRQGTALNNRGQVMNELLRVGFDIYAKTKQLLPDNDNAAVPAEVVEMLERSGVTNVIEMFNRFMFIEGDYFGGRPGPKSLFLDIPKIATKDLFHLWHKGRKRFTDEVLEGSSPTAKKVQKMLASYLIRSSQNDRIEDGKPKRDAVEALWEIYNSFNTDDMDKADIERLKQAVDNLFEKSYAKKASAILNWRIGFAFDRPSAAMFRFKQSEEMVRKEIAVMAVLAAQRSGDLKQGDWTSRDAIEVARGAVDNFAFTFTTSAVPNAMRALGSLTFQYRNYPINQWKHDARIFRSMLNGSRDENGDVNWGDLFSRVSKVLTAPGARKRTFGLSDLTKDEDKEAVIFARTVIIRTIAALVGGYRARYGLMGIPQKILLNTFNTGITSEIHKKIINGMGNPFYTTMLRMMFTGFALVAHDDDDELSDLLQTILFFMLLPPFVAAWLRPAFGALLETLSGE